MYIQNFIHGIVSVETVYANDSFYYTQRKDFFYITLSSKDTHSEHKYKFETFT